MITTKVDDTSTSLRRMIDDVQKDQKKLNKLITETYIPEDFTRRLITETVENQLSNLGKVI